MKRYEVLLSRAYIVHILAENEKEACFNVEYYLGDCEDLSGEQDRKRDSFSIKKIEPTFNEAFEVNEISTEEFDY